MAQKLVFAFIIDSGNCYGRGLKDPPPLLESISYLLNLGDDGTDFYGAPSQTALLPLAALDSPALSPRRQRVCACFPRSFSTHML